jgi:hypothetical protein
MMQSVLSNLTPGEPVEFYILDSSISKEGKMILSRLAEPYQGASIHFKAIEDELVLMLEEAQLSEQEKLQKKLELAEQARQQAEATAKARAIRSALIAEAAKAGFNDPADAYALINHDAIELDDNGEPTNAAELVKQLAEKRSYLIKQHRQTLEPFDPSGGQPIKETDAQRRARLYGGGGHIFDPLNAQNSSGGVIWPKGMPGTDEE